jgi:hypothetical protein
MTSRRRRPAPLLPSTAQVRSGQGAPPSCASRHSRPCGASLSRSRSRSPSPAVRVTSCDRDQVSIFPHETRPRTGRRQDQHRPAVVSHPRSVGATTSTSSFSSNISAVGARRQREGDGRRLTYRAIGNTRSEGTLPRCLERKGEVLGRPSRHDRPFRHPPHRRRTARSNKASASDSGRGASRADGKTG